MLYAVQAAVNLQNKAYKIPNKTITSNDVIQEELHGLVGGIEHNLGQNLKDANGNTLGHRIGLTNRDDFFKPFALDEVKKETLPLATNHQLVSFAKKLKSSIKSLLSKSLPGADGYDEGELFFNKEMDSYISPEMHNSPLSAKSAISYISANTKDNDRSKGLKAVSKHIVSGITDKNGNYNSNYDLYQIIDDIKLGKHADPSIEMEKLASGYNNSESIDINAALTSYKSEINKKRGLAFETSDAIPNYLVNNGYTAIKPKIAGNSEYEHEGTLGQFTGHPDLLATNVVQRGQQLQRRYLLADIKSPSQEIDQQATLTDLLNDKYKQEWVAQTLSYAQMLPKEIQDNLDIGILAGGPGQKTRLIKDSYSNIMKNEKATNIVDVLKASVVGTNATLDTLPNNIPTPGVVNKKDLTSAELTHVNKTYNEVTKATEKYINGLLNLANKRSGKSEQDLFVEYKMAEHESDPKKDNLKTRIDKLYSASAFPGLNRETFNAKALTTLAQLTQLPDNQRKSKIEDNLTDPNFQISEKFKPTDDFTVAPGSVPKPAEEKTIDSPRLKSYMERLNRQVSKSFYRGAYVDDNVKGHIGDDRDILTLGDSWQSIPAEMPGAVSYADAERRARLEKIYLSRYNRADMKAQTLIHEGEAKKAAIGTSGPTNFLHTFLRPGEVRKIDDKTVSYSEELNTALQQKAYYGSELDVLKGSSSTFDILNKLKTNEDKSRVNNQAVELNRALQLLDKTTRTSGYEQGAIGFDYIRSIQRLSNLGIGEDKYAQLGLQKPEQFLDNKSTEFNKGYIGAQDTRAIASMYSVFNNDQITKDQISAVSKRQKSKNADSILNSHIADYIENNSEVTEDKELVNKKRQLSRTQKLESDAMADFVSKNQVPESMQQIVSDDRSELISKHVNNALMAQTEASMFKYTPEVHKNLSGSIEVLKALGVNPMDHGIQQVHSVAGRSTVDIGKSKEAETLKQQLLGSSNSGLDIFKTKLKMGDYAAELSRKPTEALDDNSSKYFKEAEAANNLSLKLSELHKRYIELKDSGNTELATRLKKYKIDPLQKQLDTHTGNMQKYSSSDWHTTDLTEVEIQSAKTDADSRKILKAGTMKEKANLLAAELGSDGGGYTPELAEQISKLDKEGKKHFNKAIGGHANLYKAFEAYNASNTDDTEEKMTSPMKQYSLSSQVIHSYETAQKDPKQTYHGNVFDAVHAQDQAALKVINDLKSKFVEVSGGGDLSESSKTTSKLQIDTDSLISQLKTSKDMAKTQMIL
jgi:hypothetical protein